MADVVVTGRGIVTSIGETPDAFFDALLRSTSGIADGIGACVSETFVDAITTAGGTCS